MTFFAFDLDELDALEKRIPLFGYNRPRILQLRETDYLRGRPRPILEQLDEFLPPQQPGEHTLLVTSPRYFGYAFNPVNFYLRMKADRLLAAAAEVNNTFGDRHIYPLPELRRVPGKDPAWTAAADKDFHVSPFNDRSGHYVFTLRPAPESFFLGIDLYRDGRAVMHTWLRGRGTRLTHPRMAAHALLRPFQTALNSLPRILWQAAVLHYKKRLPVFKRPRPTSPRTLIDRDSGDAPPRV